MNSKEKRKKLFAVLAVLAAAALLGACGKAEEEVRPENPAATAAVVGLDNCTSCHSVQTDEWLQTPHANLDRNNLTNLDFAGNPNVGAVNAFCNTCHDPLGDSGRLTAGWTGDVNRPVVGCESCHGGGGLHYGSGPMGFASQNSTPAAAPNFPGLSAQFNTCHQCHQLLDLSVTTDAAAANTADVVHDAAGNMPLTVAEIIIDTHYASGAARNILTGSIQPTPATNRFSGYAMDYASDSVCTNCHRLHDSNLININREWAQSAHADTYISNSADPQKFFKGAWAVYNWSCDGSSNTACGGANTTGAGSLNGLPYPNSRTNCQRCHTTTGFAGYADALRVGDTARAHEIAAGNVPLVTYSPYFKPEMLECNGCHTDNKGTLRNPGPVKVSYDAVFAYPDRSFPDAAYARAEHTYPDVNGSNICLSCHTGREIGATIKGLNSQAGLGAVNFSNFAFNNVNSHYLTGGATVFRVSGYEFDGRSYTNPDSYMHNEIGTAAQPGTGTNGPCIGCHMSRPNKNGNHIFLPVSRTYSGGNFFVTGIASEVCFRCHGSSSTLILDLVEHQKELFHETMLGAFNAQLMNSAGGNYTWSPNYPYFSAKNWLSTGDPDDTGSTTGKNNLGSAFNFNLLEHDPGAYIHNRMYVKRLIYDSMDWLDDNQMNYSAGNTLKANAAHNGMPWQAGAMEYLLPYGVIPYTAAERP